MFGGYEVAIKGRNLRSKAKPRICEANLRSSFQLNTYSYYTPSNC